MVAILIEWKMRSLVLLNSVVMVKLNFYVYFMAETCCNGNKKVPECTKFPDEQMYHIPIEITVAEDVPDDYQIEITGATSPNFSGDFKNKSLIVAMIKVAQTTEDNGSN